MKPDHKANSHAGFHQFHYEGELIGSFEVFWCDHAANKTFGEQGELLDIGWFWWPCHPGCLPECEPIGPFATSAEARTDAQRV